MKHNRTTEKHLIIEKLIAYVLPIRSYWNSGQKLRKLQWESPSIESEDGLVNELAQSTVGMHKKLVLLKLKLFMLKFKISILF